VCSPPSPLKPEILPEIIVPGSPAPDPAPQLVAKQSMGANGIAELSSNRARRLPPECRSALLGSGRGSVSRRCGACPQVCSVHVSRAMTALAVRRLRVPCAWQQVCCCAAPRSRWGRARVCMRAAARLACTARSATMIGSAPPARPCARASERRALICAACWPRLASCAQAPTHKDAAEASIARAGAQVRCCPQPGSAWQGHPPPSFTRTPPYIHICTLSQIDMAQDAPPSRACAIAARSRCAGRCDARAKRMIVNRTI
jgi:hypothetical protein